nr:MAG TPA: hypothetical protein [Caudoviricetes sp.]DAZ00439.1 MAG TPA: hypothetical protein [Caudoviricetes sp.]
MYKLIFLYFKSLLCVALWLAVCFSAVSLWCGVLSSVLTISPLFRCHRACTRALLFFRPHSKARKCKYAIFTIFSKL